jgi:hypothetical protein
LVVWANSAWRQAHPQAWAMLTANLQRPLMHTDVVPTWLGAAGIAYDEPRPEVFDLLSRPVAPRQRRVQTAIGAVTSWQTLVLEAK